MRKRRKLLWIAAAAFAAILAAVYTLTTGVVEVEVSKIERGRFIQYVEDTAVVKSRESRAIYLEGQGKVTEVRVDVGDRVKKGDILLTLEKADLELKHKDAEAKINAIKAQLKGTDISNYANKIEIAHIRVQQARIAFEEARRDYENAEALHQSGALSSDNLEKVRSAYKAAEAALNSANLELDEVRKGAPDYVREGYAAQLEQAIIYKEMIADSIRKQEIRAPMDGTVMEKFIEEGSYAMPGTLALTVGDVEALKLVAEILAEDAVRVKPGIDVEVTGRVLEGRTLAGKVSKVAPVAKTVVSSLGVNQKRVQVEIELTGNDPGLKPGYNVDVKIITMIKENTLMVPETSVFEYMDADYVFVVENGRTALRKVKKGAEGNDTVEILEGLAEGEKVVAKPDNSIKEAMRVKTIP